MQFSLSDYSQFTKQKYALIEKCVFATPFSVSIHPFVCLFTLEATAWCIVRGRVPKPVGKAVKYFVPCWGHAVSVHSHSCSAALAVEFTSLMTAWALRQWCRWLTMAQSMIGRCPSQHRKPVTASLYCWCGLFICVQIFAASLLASPLFCSRCESLS